MSLYSQLSAGDWYFLLFTLFIAIFLGLALAKFLDKKNKLIHFNKELVATIITVSMFLEIIAALYLLVFDGNLIYYAWLHWLGLLVFTAVNIMLLELYLLSYTRVVYYSLSIWSLVGIAAMVFDVILNLPLSEFAGNIGGLGGANYLFGFGAAGTGSTFGVSFAFVLLLLFSVVTFAASILKMLKKQKQRKH